MSTHLNLISPENGSQTAPLQVLHWPDVKQQVLAEPKYTEYESALERSLPRPVRFSWQSAAVGVDHTRFDLLVSEHPDLSHGFVLRGLPEAAADVPNLLLNRRYYWKVIQRGTGQPAIESAVWSFKTPDLPPRWIHVPGITNVRDLGGWPVPGGRVRQGQVYRSGEMNTHIVLPAEGARVLLEDLGIRTDLDLRGLYEDPPGPALDPKRVRWVNARVQPYHECNTLVSREGFLQAFKVLTDPANYPVLFHCWGGADRAGTLAFLTNALLGVRFEDLVHDYELTSLSKHGVRNHESSEFQAFLSLLETFAPAGAPLQTQVEGYVQGLGISADEIALLRGQLFEPD
jgi:hypothetical protein